MPRNSLAGPREQRIIIDEKEHVFWLVQQSKYSWRAYGDYLEQRIDETRETSSGAINAWKMIAKGQ